MLCFLAGLALAQSHATELLLSNVSVIDVERGNVRSNQQVLIRDGLIAEVSSKPLRAAGAKTIDGAGKFLIPGLWDCHVHCWSDQLFFPLFIANGVTGIRDMFGPISTIRSWRKKMEEGTLIGPRIVAAGRIVDGPKPIWPGSVAVTNAEEGRQAVATVTKEGSDFVKVYSLLSRNSYLAIASEAKRLNRVFCGHVPNAVTAKEASDAGQKSFEHFYSVLAGCCDREAELLQAPTLSRSAKVAAMIESYNPEKAKELGRTFRKNGTWQCPTLTVLNAIAHLDDPEFRKDPRISFVSPFITGTWDVSKDRRFKSMTTEDYAALRRRIAKEMEVMAMMVNSGVDFLAGTDTPNPYAFPGFGIHDELALMVKAGFTPMQALRAATINPARYFGWEKTMGSVTQGKVADLVLLDANPLQDIRNSTKISGVFVRGRYLDQSQLAGMIKKSAKVVSSGTPVFGFDLDDH